MSKTDTWMPLYVGDYLGDTMGLQMDEHGFYFLLILYYWRSGPPPDNPDVLRAITKCPACDYMRVAGAVRRYFTVQDGRWLHKRVEIEIEKAKHNRNTAISRGKAGAKARWSNTPANAPSNASANAQASSKQWITDGPSPSPSPKEDKIDNKQVGKGPSLDITHRLKQELGSMFRRDGTDAWSYAEDCQLIEVQRRPKVLLELKELSEFRFKPDSFFPQSVETLLRDWQRTLDRARAYRPPRGVKPDAKAADVARLTREIERI